MKPVKLSELIEALELECVEQITKVDLHEGCIVTVDSSVVSAVEAGDESSLGELPDWQKHELKIARAIVDDADGRFVAAPDKFDFHEYRQMERFIRTVADSADAGELQRALKGKGAFRHFKDTANRLGFLNEWYQYRDDAMKDFVVAWAEARHIPVLDDIKPRPPHP